jgi:hypothetical protein
VVAVGQALIIVLLPHSHSWARLTIELQRERGTKGGCVLGSLVAQFSERDDVARAGIAAGFDAGFDGLAAGLRRIREAGEIGPEAEPDELRDEFDGRPPGWLDAGPGDSRHRPDGDRRLLDDRPHRIVRPRPRAPAGKRPRGPRAAPQADYSGAGPTISRPNLAGSESLSSRGTRKYSKPAGSRMVRIRAASPLTVRPCCRFFGRAA